MRKTIIEQKRRCSRVNPNTKSFCPAIIAVMMTPNPKNPTRMVMTCITFESFIGIKLEDIIPPSQRDGG